MIPVNTVTAWGAEHPWPTREQVEQDLLLSQAICAIAADDYLGRELVFRGGHRSPQAPPGSPIPLQRRPRLRAQHGVRHRPADPSAMETWVRTRLHRQHAGHPEPQDLLAHPSDRRAATSSTSGSHSNAYAYNHETSWLPSVRTAPKA